MCGGTDVLLGILMRRFLSFISVDWASGDARYEVDGEGLTVSAEMSFVELGD